MRKKIQKANTTVFVLMIIMELFFSVPFAFASECESTYGGTCSDNKNCTLSSETPLSTTGGLYGCGTDEYCCVLPCASDEIKQNFGEASCTEKSSCSKQLDYSLDCVSKIGSNGVCCLETTSSTSSSNDCQTQYSGTCKDDSTGTSSEQVCTGSTYAVVGSSLCPSGQVCCAPKSSSSSSSGIVPCGGSSDPCTLCHFIIGIKNLIDWGKNILVTATIVAIFISGIVYVVSSGNEKMISWAKSFLSASLVGFAVTLAAWLIVNVTIFWVANANSDLGIGITNWFTFTCDTTSSALSGSTTVATTAATATGNDAEIRQKLLNAGFTIQSSGNCTDRNNSSCTSFDGMSTGVADEIIAVKNLCGISTITGANETGHKNHNGYTFDTKATSSQAQCVYSNISQLNVDQLCTDSANSRLRLSCSGYDEPSGILHIKFKS